jgi:hypothetical protein
MIYFLLLLALGVILSPLLAARPTKRQREQAALRDYAVSVGLRVSLRKPPELPPRFRVELPGDLACYSLIGFGAKQALRVPVGVYAHTTEGWECRTAGVEVPQALFEPLNDLAYVVSVGRGQVDVFWSERGDNHAIDRIFATLSSFGAAESGTQ